MIVPDRHGTGTNALLLTPPDVFEPSFGDGQPRAPRAPTRRPGATAEVVEVASLALDVDTPDDLDALRDALAAPRRRRRPHARDAQPADAQPRVSPVAAVALEGLPEVRPGRRPCRADRSGRAAAAGPRAGDVVVIAHKIVSKAEGRVRALADVTPGPRRSSSRARTARTPATFRSCSTSPRSCCARHAAC